MVYLERKAQRELDHPDKLDHYLAQLAYEMRLSWISEKGKKELDKDLFFIKFESRKKVVEETELDIPDEERKKIQLNAMKSSWGALMSSGKFSKKKPKPKGTK